MTIIVAMGNSEHFYLISDRRLSSGAKIVNEFYNKATVINTANGRFGVGFTGVATAYSHSTQESLVNVMYDILKEDKDFYNLPNKLADKLTDLFKVDPILKILKNSDKRLSILMGGYLTDAFPPALATAIISNYQDFKNNVDKPEADDTFTVTYEQEKRDPRPENPVLIQRVGAWKYLSNNDIDELRGVLSKALPVKTIEEMIVGIVRRISDDSKFLVGKDVAIITIPSDLTKQPGSKIHYNDGQTKIEAPDAIFHNSSKDAVVSIKNLKIYVEGNKEQTKIFTPKLGRNDRCYCGSGIKYKKCHGK